MSAPIRVLVVDDDPLVRAGIAMILDAAPGLTLVGEAADGTAVVQAVEAYAPDVVLMDIRMPKLDGLAATELLRARPDPPEVIVLTTFHADEYVLRALRAGASGFLLKDTRPTEIYTGIHTLSLHDALPIFQAVELGHADVHQDHVRDACVDRLEDRKSTRLNSSHGYQSRMPSSA